MKKFTEIYTEALRNETLRNELTEAVAEKKLAEFLKAHDCDTDIEEIREFLTKRQSEAQNGDIELSIDDLEDIAGGANKFLATLLAGLTIATAIAPATVAAADIPYDTADTPAITMSAEQNEDDIDLDFDMDDETQEEDVKEVVLPTEKKDENKKQDIGSLMDDFMQKSIESLFALGKEKLGENLPDLSEKLFDSIPVANYLNKVGLGKKVGSLIANAFGIAPETEPSMRDIKNQLQELSKDIENAKNDIKDHADSNLAREIKAIENIQTVSEYKSGMQQLANAFNDVQDKLSEVNDAPEQDQLVQMASLCGSSKYWTVEGTLVCSLTKVGSFISGNKNFISDKNFYESLYQLAVNHGAVFSGQAKNEVETYVTDTVETYMAAYAIAVASLDAQQTLREIKDSDRYQEFLDSLSPTMKQTCVDIVSNKYDITSKKKALGRLLGDADGNGNTKTVLGQYKNFVDKSSGIFISREGQFTTEKKDVVIGAAEIRCDDSVKGASDASYRSLYESWTTALDFDQVIKYAKTYKKSIAEVLQDANFEIPANTKYLLAETKISKTTGDGKDNIRSDSKGNVYGDSWYNDIYTVKAYDIFSKDIKPETVVIKKVEQRKHHVNNKEYKVDPRVIDRPTINFLTMCEKTDTSVSAIGKLTNKGNENKYIISSGEYKLSQNLNIKDAISVASGTKATIDLNGFTLNCTDNSHPAITVESGAELTIIDSSNGKGSIKGYNSVKGGVVFVSKNAKCTLKGIKSEGSASLEGGVVRNEGNLTVEKCTFNNNGATNNGGVIANFGSAKISETKFTNNKAGNRGGVIYNGGYCEADHVEFTKNQSVDGGAIFNTSSGIIKITYVTLSENKATKYGGGAVSNYGSFSAIGFTINNNTAAARGGAIWTNNSVYLKDGIMEYNSNGADQDGGAIMVTDGSLEIHDASLSFNKSGHDGGAIRCSDDDATIKVYDTKFEGNTAARDGGAGSIRGKNEFHNCKFYNNKASNKGGALDLAGSSRTNFYGCNIYDNTAPKGSAIRYDNSAKYYFYENTQVEGSIY